MTRDQRTRRGRREQSDRLFVARRAIFCLAVFAVLVAAAVAAVLGGVDRQPHRAGTGPGTGRGFGTGTVTCPSAPAGRSACGPPETAVAPAAARH